ncbi:hypothetical protein VNI00_012632 [Paramarasmius palmivorus]|uniref:Uncharacterized protein n=1 Tax=Paramarasmius palmivorus TaxID=297713 RepID=A0AAW0C457_9AGAR
MSSDNAEDILNDSLSFFGGKPVVDSDIISYGPLRLTVAPKEGKANTLLADHLFSPSLFLAERIERGLIPIHKRTVVELGSGCGLPSLLMATNTEPPRTVVLTDYPDEGILGNLKDNVDRNRNLFSQECTVHLFYHTLLPEASSTSDRALVSQAETNHPGFDIVVLSDLLHFHSSHDVAYVAAGKYTQPHVCDSFIDKAKASGFSFEEVLSPDEESEWMGKLDVSDLDKEALSTRKAACRFWVGRWA